jgi:UTP:GlnB (protein PII) uridylyltransferase
MRAVSPRCGTAGRRRCCANCTPASPKCWPAACPPPSATCACSAPRKPRRALLGRLVRSGQHRRIFLELGYPGYWLSFDPETHARHARLVRDAEATQGAADRGHAAAAGPRGDRGDGLCADHAGLFSRIAGALAVAGASIVDARIHTLTNGMALDTFWIQDAAGGAFDAAAPAGETLSVLIEQALSGHLRLPAEIRKVVARCCSAAHARDPRAAARGDRQPCVSTPTRCWR